MNCFNHPSKTAVASCIDCGKGLCHSCASTYTQPICNNCNATRKKGEIIQYIKPLIICPILFLIGSNLEIMGPDRVLGGYMFMCIYAGWSFASQFLSNVFVWFELRAILLYYLVRIALAMFIGVFVTPFYLGWCVYKLIRVLLK